MPAIPLKLPPPPPQPRPWEWSIADAWTWLRHAWSALIHIPYLGLLSLTLAGLLALIVLARLLGGR